MRFTSTGTGAGGRATGAGLSAFRDAGSFKRCMLAGTGLPTAGWLLAAARAVTAGLVVLSRSAARDRSFCAGAADAWLDGARECSLRTIRGSSAGAVTGAAKACRAAALCSIESARSGSCACEAWVCEACPCGA
ncbi:hypothetical protein [Variovorax sp. OV329]|uniref:hypothetical protein n=1 Tax=Variovorax sp. OV329 TaxID=1882825 RepID=UPI0011140E58|nr:hypothetical protein [Variovorax sp. OV329]